MARRKPLYEAAPKPQIEGPAPDPRRIVTQAVKYQRQAFIEELLLRGSSLSAIKRASKQALGIGADKVEEIILAIRAQWARDLEDQRPIAKQAAIMRLTKAIQKAKEDEDGNQLPPAEWQWTAIASMERLLADIQGTREAIKVDVNVAVSQAVLHVVGSLSPQEMDSLVAEYDTLTASALPRLDAPSHIPHTGTNGAGSRHN